MIRHWAMKFTQHSVKSVADLLDRVAFDRNRLNDSGDKPVQIWYRGLTKASHGIVPTLYHAPPLTGADEIEFLSRFKQNAPQSGIVVPNDEYGWLLLARHYGLRSRLIDWTESPMIGLYFAVEQRNGPETIGAIWCLLPKEFNREIPQFFGAAGETLPWFGPEDPTFFEYLPNEVQRLDDPSLAPRPVAFLAPRLSPRLQTQQAVFTIHHAVPTPLEKLAPHHIWRYVIPAAAKRKIRDELHLLVLSQPNCWQDRDGEA